MIALVSQHEVVSLQNKLGRCHTSLEITRMHRLIEMFCGICGDMLEAGGYATQQQYIDTGRAVVLPPETEGEPETVVLVLPQGLEGAEGRINVVLSTNFFNAQMTPVGAGVLLTLMTLRGRAIREYEEGNKREYELVAIQYHRVRRLSKTLPESPMIQRALD